MSGTFFFFGDGEKIERGEADGEGCADEKKGDFCEVFHIFYSQIKRP